MSWTSQQPQGRTACGHGADHRAQRCFARAFLSASSQRTTGISPTSDYMRYASPLLFRSSEFTRLVAEDTETRLTLEAVELAAFLQPPASTASARTPGSLLAADVEAVAFTGREHVLSELARWRDSSSSTAIALVAGEGWPGKPAWLGSSPLVHMPSAGSLDPPEYPIGTANSANNEPIADLGKLLRVSGRPILIVADYAETHPDDIAAIIEEVQGASPLQSPIRLLLLARAVGAWWESLSEDTSCRRYAAV